MAINFNTLQRVRREYCSTLPPDVGVNKFSSNQVQRFGVSPLSKNLCLLEVQRFGCNAHLSCLSWLQVAVYFKKDCYLVCHKVEG